MSRSIPEVVVGYYIKKSYPNVLFNYKGFKWNIGPHGGKSEFDIYIPPLQLAIEYDGYFYHNESKLANDIRKNELAKEHNVTVLRLREEGCPEISGNNILTDVTHSLEKYRKLFADLQSYISHNHDIFVSDFTDDEIRTYMEMAKIEKKKDINTIITKFCKAFKTCYTDKYCKEISFSGMKSYDEYTDRIIKPYRKLKWYYDNNLLIGEQIAKLKTVYPNFGKTEFEIRISEYEKYRDWYKKQNPDTPVRNSTVVDISGEKYNLGIRINHFRENIKNNKFSESEMELLKNHCPELFAEGRYQSYQETKKDNYIDSLCAELAEYFKKNPNESYISQKTTFNGSSIGQKVNKLRIRNKEGKLTPEQKAKIEMVYPNCFSDLKVNYSNEGKLQTYSDDWNKTLQLYKEYIAEKGTSVVPVRSVSGENMYKDVNLGSWVHHQRAKMQNMYADYLAGKLDSPEWSERIKNLMDIIPENEKDTYFADKNEMKWNENFLRLKNYVANNPDDKLCIGIYSLPEKEWFKKQIQNYTSDKFLNENQVKKLETLCPCVFTKNVEKKYIAIHNQIRYETNIQDSIQKLTVDFVHAEKMNEDTFRQICNKDGFLLEKDSLQIKNTVFHADFSSDDKYTDSIIAIRNNISARLKSLRMMQKSVEKKLPENFFVNHAKSTPKIKF